MSKRELFVVVREDRHVDDEITVHATRTLADAAVDEFKDRYFSSDGRYKRWNEHARLANGRWVRYVYCFDGGPNVRIEVCELDGEL